MCGNDDWKIESIVAVAVIALIIYFVLEAMK